MTTTAAALSHSHEANTMHAMSHLLTARSALLAGIQSTPAVRSLIGGRPDPESYKAYLINVWHYARHSAEVIGLAGARCAPDNPALASYLFQHAQEELGHEKWALEDLGTLGITEAELSASTPLPSCAAMIGYEYYVAGRGNPVGLFGWLYMLEAMGEDLGPVISTRLSQAFDQRTGVRFVRAHGEADELHTRDLTYQIATHVKPADMAEVNHVANVVSRLYLGIFEQLPH